MITSLYLRSFQDERFTVIWDSQDIQDTLESVGFPEEFRTDITGIAMLVRDGELLDIWLSESNTPYSLNSIYHPLPYYKNAKLNQAKHLPYYWSKNNSYYRTQQLTELLDKKGL